MIQLHCECGHLLQLDDDMAGGLAQCPRCAQLLEVGALQPLPEALPLVDDQPLPVTSIEPTAATLRYAADDTFWPLPRLLLWLLMPANLVVLLAIFVMSIAAAGLALLLPILDFIALPVAAAILAHYGVVIDETGPLQRDALPRPLRDLDMRDDLLGPLLRVLLAIGLCFWPAMLVTPQLIPQTLRQPTLCQVISWGTQLAEPSWLQFYATVFFLLAGSLVFPAVLLTACAGGSLWNLRPDRVVDVMRRCGRRYGSAWLACLLAGLFYLAGTVGPAWLPAEIADALWLDTHQALAAMCPLLALAAYCGHWGCCQLGLLYREHHLEFAWILQRHVPQSVLVGRAPSGQDRPLAGP